MVSENYLSELKRDRGIELFPDEFIPHTVLIQRLSQSLFKKRTNPTNGRRFESDIQYNLYPEILPKKLHQLINNCLICINEIEKTPNYKIDNNFYHSFSLIDKICYLDFVGCLIAIRYRIHYTIEVMPKLFPLHIASKFEALELFFSGELKKAVEMLLQELPEELPEKIKLPDYFSNPNDFKTHVQHWQLKLQTLNL